MKKVSVRGQINALEVGRELVLPKNDYVPSTARSTAASIKEDTGKSFSVSAKGNEIVVTRLK